MAQIDLTDWYQAREVMRRAVEDDLLGGASDERIDESPLDRFIVDFYCPRLRLVVEVDGATHDGPDATIRDAERTRFLRARGLRVVRLTNGAVLHCFADACAWLADRMAEQQRQAP